MERTKTGRAMAQDDQSQLLFHRYQQLVEASGDVIYTVNVSGICTYVNASVQRLFGYSQEDVIGHFFTEFVHPDWREKVFQFYMEQFRSRTEETVFEFPAVTRDGDVKWVEQIVMLHIDTEADWVTGFSGFVRDITRRKQAEDQLRAIIDAVPDHIYVKDTEHRFVLVNRATWMNEGLSSAEEMVGLTDVDLYGEDGLQDRAAEAELMRTGKPIYNLERENHKSPFLGKREVVLINKVPLVGAGGEVVGLIGINRDITERKEAENQLQHNENTLRTIIESSTDLIFIKDRDFRYILFNPAGVRLLQRPVESILGKTDAELFNEAIATETAKFDRHVLETGESVTYEIQRTFPDGVHWMLITKFPFVSSQGGLMGIVGIGHDITERKLAEAELAESEQRYRAVVDDQTELICRFNADTILTFVNEAYCRYFGKRKEELIGRSFLDLIPAEEHESIRQNIAQMMNGAAAVSYEHPVIAADGSIRWQEWTDRAILDASGRFVEFQSAGRDITERRLAEAERDEYLNRLEVLQRVDMELSQHLNLDTVLDIALDASVRLSKASAGAIHLLEGKQLKVAKVIGDYPAEIVGTFISKNFGLIGRAARTQAPEWVADVSKDKDYRANVPGTIAQITVPLISQDRLIGTLNIQTNQTDLFTQKTFDFIKLLAARIAAALDNARLYQMLEQQYQQVSELEQLKTQLIHVAAHDIRSPLGVIDGYLQMLNDDPSLDFSPRHKEYLSFMDQSAKRIDKISQDILTLERVERMQKGTNTETLDLGELVNAIYHEFKPQAAMKELDFLLHPSETMLPIVGDPVFLRETVVNLISNAVKYTPSGGKVCVRAKGDKHSAIFEVEDTGYGIPQDQQRDLFKPFSRIRLRETREIKGTGLGLHLVKSIVEKHNGEIIFKSVYEKGSTFGFRLPLVAAAKTRKK